MSTKKTFTGTGSDSLALFADPGKVDSVTLDGVTVRGVQVSERDGQFYLTRPYNSNDGVWQPGADIIIDAQWPADATVAEKPAVPESVAPEPPKAA